MHPGPWWTQSRGKLATVGGWLTFPAFPPGDSITKRLITGAGRRSLAAASQPIERRHQLASP
jgi:hypothetical protein